MHTIAPTARVATRVPVERDSYWAVTTGHAQVRTACDLDNEQNEQLEKRLTLC